MTLIWPCYENWMVKIRQIETNHFVLLSVWPYKNFIHSLIIEVWKYCFPVKRIIFQRATLIPFHFIFFLKTCLHRNCLDFNKHVISIIVIIIKNQIGSLYCCAVNSVCDRYTSYQSILHLPFHPVLCIYFLKMRKVYILALLSINNWQNTLQRLSHGNLLTFRPASAVRFLIKIISLIRPDNSMLLHKDPLGGFRVFPMVPIPDGNNLCHWTQMYLERVLRYKYQEIFQC